MSTNNLKKIYIGFITYGSSTAPYLPYFLPSLMSQINADCKIVAIDNSEEKDNDNLTYIKNNYPEIVLEWAGKNLGFSKAFNLMIKKAVDNGAEYFLALNPDMILEPDMVNYLVKELDNNKKLGSVSPKILRWDFADKKKTKIIDTCGIILLPGLRFADSGQGAEDQGQYDDSDIIGPSGSAALYRISALEKIKQPGEYFDELMFMYKEDCDLAYRLFLAGFKSKCVSSGIAFHDRSSGRQGNSDLKIILNRKNINRQVKKWSFLHQQIIFKKFWGTIDLKNKLALILYQIKIFIFILFFEPYLIKQLLLLYKIRKAIKIY